MLEQSTQWIQMQVISQFVLEEVLHKVHLLLEEGDSLLELVCAPAQLGEGVDDGVVLAGVGGGWIGVFSLCGLDGGELVVLGGDLVAHVAYLAVDELELLLPLVHPALAHTHLLHQLAPHVHEPHQQPDVPLLGLVAPLHHQLSVVRPLQVLALVVGADPLGSLLGHLVLEIEEVHEVAQVVVGLVLVGGVQGVVDLLDVRFVDRLAFHHHVFLLLRLSVEVARVVAQAIAQAIAQVITQVGRVTKEAGWVVAAQVGGVTAQASWIVAQAGGVVAEDWIVAQGGRVVGSGGSVVGVGGEAEGVLRLCKAIHVGIKLQFSANNQRSTNGQHHIFIKQCVSTQANQLATLKKHLQSIL